MVALYILLCCLFVWILMRSKDLRLSEFIIACIILVPMLAIESQTIIESISLCDIVPQVCLTNKTLLTHDIQIKSMYIMCIKPLCAMVSVKS